MFTGEHVLWTHMFFERSINIPMILMGRRDDDRVGVGLVDIRLVSPQDIMPTRLHLLGVEIRMQSGLFA